MKPSFTQVLLIFERVTEDESFKNLLTTLLLGIKILLILDRRLKEVKTNLKELRVPEYARSPDYNNVDTTRNTGQRKDITGEKEKW